ncbi:MAG: hypothetical protein ACRYGG_13940 [Janthinobacterium lividum]
MSLEDATDRPMTERTHWLAGDVIRLIEAAHQAFYVLLMMSDEDADETEVEEEFDEALGLLEAALLVPVCHS